MASRSLRTFDRELLEREALRRLDERPALPWIERPQARGELVIRWCLPVWLCQTSNAARRQPDWYYSRIRADLFRLMLPVWIRSGRRRGEPLSGRPQVLALRCSPRAPDPCSDWAKAAVDRPILPLTIKRKGRTVDCKRFGLIEDDRPECADVKQWWEPCAAAASCVLLSVWSG